MKLKMELLSDVIFANGISVPGAEDISVLRDVNGFPYYKGGTFKGVFREEYERILELKGVSDNEAEVARLLGRPGSNDTNEKDKLMFGDFELSDVVKNTLLEEIGTGRPEEILDSLTHLRAFTAIGEDGTAKKGSLRLARCVNKGMVFWGEITCLEKDKEIVKETLGMIKWIGSMRNRGFGRVKITEAEDA